MAGPSAIGRHPYADLRSCLWQQRHVAKHTKKPSEEAAAPVLAGQLPPATVAAFRAAWPSLDPAACKTDFDAWLLGKTQPRNYAQAFLGFAAKWASRKT